MVSAPLHAKSSGGPGMAIPSMILTDNGVGFNGYGLEERPWHIVSRASPGTAWNVPYPLAASCPRPPEDEADRRPAAEPSLAMNRRPRQADTITA